MKVLWKSPDNYIVVADGLAFPDEDDRETYSDLEALFRGHAWIVVWRAAEDQRREQDERWHMTRSRQMPKPSLNALRHALRAHVTNGNTIADQLRIAPEDRCGFVFTEDVVIVAQALYSAWGYTALEKLPAYVEQRKLNPDDYNAADVSPWLRPGIPLHRERRREFRELMEEIAV